MDKTNDNNFNNEDNDAAADYINNNNNNLWEGKLPESLSILTG